MKFSEDVSIEHEGKRYTLTLAQLEQCLAHEPEWMNVPGHPSSWLVDRVYSAARNYGGTPEAAARELTARALGITVEHVQSSLAWNDAYMRWHDGGPPKDD